MKFGIDRLLEDETLRAPLAGQRVALRAHPASVTADLTHSLDALIAAGTPAKLGDLVTVDETLSAAEPTDPPCEFNVIDWPTICVACEEGRIEPGAVKLTSPAPLLRPTSVPG